MKILLYILSSNKKNGLRTSLAIIKYSSIIMVLGSIAAIIVSIKPELLFQQMIDDSIKSVFLEKVLFVTSLHFIIPVFVIFFVLAFVTRTVLKIWKNK